MALMLSWYILDAPRRYPQASKKYLVHNSYGITSSVAKISVSVYFLVFSFCLWDVEYSAPFPIDIIPPMWPLMLITEITTTLSS